VKIRMQEGESFADLTANHWDIGVVGRTVDDRGRAAAEFLSSRTGRLVSVEYDPEEFDLDFGGSRLNAEEVDQFVSKLDRGSVLLETTTLGFVEIFLLCRALRKLGVPKLALLYVEPLSYSNPRRSQLLERRDFELSEKVPGYKAIPGATLMLTDRTPQRAVFFLGYEGERLERALEDYQMIKPAHCSVVFGVPAFRPGWEMDAFANNIRVIGERNVRGGVYFCGAENPVAAFELLTELHRGLLQNERLFIGPIGTKPNGIGVALFAATHENIGILYDHPRRRAGRSYLTGRWHLFDVEFES